MSEHFNIYRQSGNADKHITLWHKTMFYKRAGTAAPMGKNLEEYLQKHDEWEIYSGQDKNLPPGFQYPRVTLWDTRNKRKIAGAATPLSNHLEQYLADHSDVVVYEGQTNEEGQNSNTARVVLWNTLVNKKVAGRAAPQRKDLTRYLQQRPHMEEYNGQDQLAPVYQPNFTLPQSDDDSSHTAENAESLCDPPVVPVLVNSDLISPNGIREEDQQIEFSNIHSGPGFEADRLLNSNEQFGDISPTARSRRTISVSPQSRIIWDSPSTLRNAQNDRKCKPVVRNGKPPNLKELIDTTVFFVLKSEEKNAGENSRELFQEAVHFHDDIGPCKKRPFGSI